MHATAGHGGTISARAAGLCLMVLYLCLYLLPLASRPLIRPDEIRYAEISREMVVSGDWVSPRFDGARYFEKPILGYWLNSVSLELLGENNFAIRLPSALAAIATGLLVFLLTGTFANTRARLFASGIYATSLGVLAIGTFVVLDSLFTLFVSGTMGACWLALRADGRARRNSLLALSGFACGCAFLTKGFVAVAIPTLAAGAFLAWERRWRDLWRAPWIPLAVATVTALPWAIAIGLREPDFWHYFFWVEHVGRFFSASAQHAQPWWYYLAALPLLMFPWVFLVPRAVAGLRTGSIDRAFIRFLACWAVLPVVFFSLSQGKLATYVLPCLVPLAILSGVGLERCAASAGRLNLKWSALGLAAFLAVAIVALAAAQRGAFGEPLYGSMDRVRYAGLLTMLAGTVIAALWAGRSSAAWLQMLLVGSAVLPLHLAATVALPLRIAEQKGPSLFLAEHAGDYTDAILVSDSSLFGTTSWALRRSDVYVIGGGEIDYGLSYPDDEQRWLDERSLARLIGQNESEADVLIFCRTGTEERIRSALSGRGMRTQQGDLVLWRIPARVGRGDG